MCPKHRETPPPKKRGGRYKGKPNLDEHPTVTPTISA